MRAEKMNRRAREWPAKSGCCQDSCVNDGLAQLLSRLPNSNILANVSKLIRFKNAINKVHFAVCAPVVVRACNLQSRPKRAATLENYAGTKDYSKGRKAIPSDKPQAIQ